MEAENTLDRSLNQRHHDCNSQNKVSVGTHKPDYVERSDKCNVEQGIITLGEIKGILSVDQEFPDEDVGQILDFLQELLIKQVWRQWVFGFLTDSVRFEFFRGMKVFRVDGIGIDISFTRSGLLSKQNGWKLLSQLLQQSDEILGFKVINVTGWKLGSSLGSGATTSVFSATSTSSDGKETAAVCKIFTGPQAVLSHKNESR